VPGTVTAIKRVLKLIHIMNTRPLWTLEELTASCGLPKSSVHRLLATLEEAGYVQSAAGRRGLYRLSGLMSQLASGISEDVALADIARPTIIAGTKHLKWPLTLAVAEGFQMRVIFCGMPYSHFASKTTTVGHRYAMFTSALGLSYFSHACPRERRVIVQSMKDFMIEQETRFPHTIAEIAREVRRVRRQGYSFRRARSHEISSAVGVPVGLGENLLGSIVCSTFAHSLDPRHMEQLLPELRRIADQIFTNFTSQSSKDCQR